MQQILHLETAPAVYTHLFKTNPEHLHRFALV